MGEAKAIGPEHTLGCVHRVASMTARVIEYLSSLLPPWSGRGSSDRLEPIDFILREFENLEAVRQKEVARDLAQLWDAFVEHFGGIVGS